MQISVILLVILGGGEGFAQPDTLWTRSYRVGPTSFCNRLISTPDGGFALGIQSDNNSNADWGLVKVDSTGRRQWSRIYHSEDTLGTLDDVFEGLAVAPDGSYYITGRWNNNRAQLMRVDSIGREIWSNNYEIRDDDEFLHVCVAQDGNPVCAGTTVLDCNLVKISSDGDVLWHHAYGGRGTDLFLRVISTRDGGFLAVGWTTSFGGMKAYAVKTDRDGNQEWARTFNENREGHVFISVVESPEGGYLAVGNGEFNGSLRLYWVRMTADGDSLWSGVLEHENDGAGFLLDATYAPNGGFLIIGESREYEYASYRLDRNGEIMWRLDVGDYPDQEWFETVLTLDDGSYAIGGRKGNPPVDDQAWLVRTKPDPEFNSVVLLDPAFPSAFRVASPYPNPFNSTIRLSYSLPTPSQTSIRIYNQLGHQVAVIYEGRAQQAGPYAVTWDASGQTTGVYFCKVVAGGNSATMKVVLVK